MVQCTGIKSVHLNGGIAIQILTHFFHCFLNNLYIKIVKSCRDPFYFERVHYCHSQKLCFLSAELLENTLQSEICFDIIILYST
jgi:hypothetical protein